MDVNNGKSLIEELKGISKQIDYEFKSDNTIEILAEINQLYFDWESQLAEEKNKPYRTDFVEKEICEKSKLIVKIIIGFYNYLVIEYENELVKLYEHRHFGYAFFLYDLTNPMMVGFKIEEMYRYDILYSSLCEFYIQFYGDFDNNETAIELLCVCYRRRLLRKFDQNKLVNAIFPHIKNAGNYGDTGYAYNGLKLIQTHVHRLGDVIISRIIARYMVRDISNNYVYREQMIALIQSLTYKDEEKRELKFLYIDSIIMADSVIGFLSENTKNAHISNSYYDDISCIQPKRLIWGNFNGEKVFLRYYGVKRISDSKNKQIALLESKSKQIAVIEFSDDEIKYTINSNKVISGRIKFDFYDYSLNNMEIKTLFKEWFFELYGDIEMGDFLFSYIWLENYRNIRQQQITFDNTISVNYIENDFIIKKADNIKMPESFYSESIYSMNALIGKNGSGKTNILDFLRASFFKIIEDIAAGNLISQNGIVSKEELVNLYSDVNICDFFVVFKVTGVYYYLTTKPVNKEFDIEIKPYLKKSDSNPFETTKIINFSNIIDFRPGNVGKSLYKEKGRTYRESFVDISTNNTYIKEYELQKEYSEIKTNDFDKSLGSINEDFFKQLAFIDFLLTDGLEEIYSLDDIKNLSFIGEGIGSKFEKTQIKDIYGQKSADKSYCFNKIMEIVSEHSDMWLYRFEYFSTGQYAKFVFLARIFWCLKGFDLYGNRFYDQYGIKFFKASETILPDSSALIFIDEGEVFYHPEWQREYINTLVTLINKTTIDKKINLQIVITSNSPFILSDLPRENIELLSNDETDKRIDLTFGGNIHTMLREGFFLESTIGKFANDKIKEAIDIIKKDDITAEEREKIEFIISILQEPIVKKQIQEKYQEKFNEEALNLQEIDEEIKKLNKKREKLLSNDTNQKQ